MPLRMPCLLSFACVLAVTVAGAQRSATPPDTARLRCTYNDEARSNVGRRTLPGGFIVTISRANDAVEHGCAATVTSAEGKEVFHEAAFNVAVNDATGMDVDGDGSPELVLDIDTGGGNHCCWSLVVVTFKARPRVLFDFDVDGTHSFRRDARGRVTLWSWEGGISGTDGTMAGRLFAQKVYRWTNNKLVDETPVHCGEIDADTSGYRIRIPGADTLRRLAKFGAQADSAYGIAGDIEQLMLQEIFCERFERALAIGRLWPAPTRADFIAHFRDLVVAAYSQYAAPLKDWR